jgi:hypothetical protein
MATLKLDPDQKCTLEIAPVDKLGNPAPVENVRWVSSDEAVVTLVAVDGNPNSVVAMTTGAIGAALVTVTTDPIIGEGEAELVGTLTIEVPPLQAVALSINAGAPESR